MNPTFTADRLLVRPRHLNDLEQCIAMDQDPRVTQYINGPWAEPVQHRAFVLERMTAAYPEGHGYWSVFDRFADQDVLLG